MGMELDNVLQLTFGLLALLTTIAVSYITWRFAVGTLFHAALCGDPVRYSHVRPLGRRQRRCRSWLIGPPMLSYDNPPSRIPSDRWYCRRAIFMEDTIWSGGLNDEVYVT
jgi:hypothetical protein